jgi:CIC family chloride channel protein
VSEATAAAPNNHHRWAEWLAWMKAQRARAGVALLSDENTILLAAILVGVLSGLGSAAFIYSLAGVHHLFFVTFASWLGWLGPSAVIILPALGGLLVGPFIARFAPEARGHGVPEVMSAVATRGGRIAGRVAIVKIIASAISIGSGGSAGQEGPMVQIGAATASAAGRRFGVPPHHMRTFVACGAAGGLAAVFNAPIGGAIFALEVITGELTPAFGAVILASVSATVVSRSLFGNFPSFVVPRYDLVSNSELLFYVVLGVLAGLASVAFIRTLYALEDRFDAWEFPQRFKPVVGGLALGIIGRFYPEVFGTGSDTIQAATWGTLAPLLLLVLIPLKMVSTSITLASGGSGGVFGPAMYVGAVLGGAFGWLVHTLFPGMTAGSGAYALVGIGGVVGGTALAPLTAIILLFEMTDDYRIILPMMVVTAISVIVTRSMVGESIYTLKLRQQNIGYYQGAEIERTHGLTVSLAMRKGLPTLDVSTDVVAALARAVKARATALAVTEPGEDGDVLIGAVTAEQLAAASVDEKRPPDLRALVLPAKDVVVAPDERLDAALDRLAAADNDVLLVAERTGPASPPLLLGVLTRRDILRIYERVLRRS